MLAAFGKTRVVDDIRADDFSQLRVRLSRKWGKHRLAKTIQFTRCVFKWAFDSELIDRTVRFGPGFKKPSRKVMRQHRRTQGQKMFTPDEIHALLGKASTQLRAMILLGINAAYGNSDCGNLPRSALDLENGWATFPRPKTEADRRAPLWAETVQAIEQALAERPEPKNPEHKDLVFVTRCGDSWFKPTPDGPISREFGKLLRALKINGRAGLGFYSLRHTHRTIADEVKDQPAAARIMGHAADGNDMSDSYREYIADERLRAITDHVRSWLFAKQPTENTTEPRAIIPMSTAKVS
jgi:integrase